jgi:hypothetical protein
MVRQDATGGFGQDFAFWDEHEELEPLVDWMMQAGSRGIIASEATIDTSGGIVRMTFQLSAESKQRVTV